MKKLLCVLLPLLMLFCACQSSDSGYIDNFGIADQHHGMRDGMALITYHVVFGREPTNDELFEAFKSVLDDGFERHEMFFYAYDDRETLSSPVAKISEPKSKTMALTRVDGTTAKRSGYNETVLLLGGYLIFMLFVMVFVYVWAFFIILRAGARDVRKKFTSVVDHPGEQLDARQEALLKSLSGLLSAGVITPAEFEERRRRL